jgi:hypothetical protein
MNGSIRETLFHAASQDLAKYSSFIAKNLLKPFFGKRILGLHRILAVRGKRDVNVWIEGMIAGSMFFKTAADFYNPQGV